MTDSLDDRPIKLQQAVSALQRKRAFKREMAKAEPQIRSGVCQGCDHFTSLHMDSDYCERCHDEVHAAPEAVIILAKREEPSPFAIKPDRYWTPFIHGFISALVIVVAVTAMLLWKAF